MKSDSTFADRGEAAEALAASLLDYRGHNPLILAIPRGAVPMGKIIADRLDGELDIVLVRKLGAPFNPEYALGAIDETGWVHLNRPLEGDGEANAFVASEKARQLQLLQERRARYTPSHHPVDPEGRIVIVVDDGLATGATMIAALHAIRARNPAELVCAVPVGAPESLASVMRFADRMVCLKKPENFFAVGQFYRHFSQVEDDEVTRILTAASSHRKAKGT
ncbi:MAG: phosphoribosyl transferase [Burkholderiales bacterium RIFCSPLOWO2_02_FULL_57_36]|nr:MAG: phosphoribosyl transferase [Burkholderiales bacterium RIFCSPLOWO2_02_FULL_57_36]